MKLLLVVCLIALAVGVPTCPIPAQTDAYCNGMAQVSCGSGITTTFFTCRQRFFQHCKNPTKVTDAEVCLQERCDHLEGDEHNPADRVRAVCRGTYDYNNVPADQLQFFPNGVPKTQLPGLKDQCHAQVCVDPTEAPTTEKPTEAPTTEKPTEAPTTEKPTEAPTEKPTEKPHTCVLVPQPRDVCQELSFQACSGGVTATFGTCRNAFIKWCKNPKQVTDEETCLRERCDTLEGDEHHPAEQVHKACRGGYDFSNLSEGMQKYFPNGVPAHGVPGLRDQCRAQTCQETPTETPTTVKPTDAPTEKPTDKPTDAPTEKPTEAPTEKPTEAPTQPPAPTCAPVPAVPELPNIIYIAAEEEDCTADLRVEADELELIIEKLYLLLIAKGVKIEDECAPPPPPTFPGETTTTLATTTVPPTGETTVPPTGGETTGHSSIGESTVPPTGGETTGHSSIGESTVPPTGGETTGHSSNGETTVPPTGGETTGHSSSSGDHTTGATQEQSAQGTRSASSGGGSSALLVAAVVIGSAVAAGIFAVAIGFIVAGSAASGAAPLSAAPMAACAQNPLYTPTTSGADNAMFQ